MNKMALITKFYAILSLFFVASTAASMLAKDFFRAPEAISVRLSPDGKKIAGIGYEGKKQILFVVNADTLKKKRILDLKTFTPKNSYIQSISWIDNSHISTQYIEKTKGVSDLKDTWNSQYMLVVGLPDKAGKDADVRSVRTSGWLVDSLPEQDDTFLYAKSGIVSAIYKLKVNKLSQHKQKLTRLMKRDGGQFTKKNEVTSVKGYVTRWFFVKDKPKAILGYIDEGNLALKIMDDEKKWKLIKSWRDKELESDSNSKKFSENETKKLFIPIAISNKQNKFYCLDLFENVSKTVYLVDFESNKNEIIYQSSEFEIVDLIVSEKQQNLIGVQVIEEGEMKNIYLDKERAIEHEQLKKDRSRISVIVNHSVDDSNFLIYTEYQNQPGQYFLGKKSSKKLKHIVSVYPHLDNKLQSHQIEDKLALNGLDIPYILTIPGSEKAKKSHPLIVIPHGGPIGVFDKRYFDLITQFLVNNHFAVLRVNYRGSGGYGLAFKEAGKRQWGKLMLSDIYNVAKVVVTRADINQHKVCIFGMSYGGYAATMLPIQHPEFFQCAVNVAGVSDINLFLNSTHISQRQDAWLKKYVGDTVADYEDLKNASPVYLVKDLTIPILIMHGAKDKIVDIEHASRLKLMLEKFHKNFSWHIFPEGEHTLGDTEQQIEFFTLIVEFLNKNI